MKEVESFGTKSGDDLDSFFIFLVAEVEEFTT